MTDHPFNSPFQPITLTGKVPNTKDIPRPISLTLSCVPRMIHSSYQTRPGQSAYLRKYTVQRGCEGKRKQWGRKVSSTKSYLSSFDQEEWWIRKDSPEVST